MCGRVVTPVEAHALGLVQMLSDDALDTARGIARRLSALPPVAVAMAKKVVYAAADLPMEHALAAETEGSFRTKQSADAAARMAEYLAVPPDGRRAWLEGDRTEE